MSQYAWTLAVWEEEFFNCLGQDSQEGEAAEDDDSDESGPLEANPKVKGYKEAISSLEEVQLFLNNRGDSMCKSSDITSFVIYL